MAKRQLPSPEVLRQLLRYEPETGNLFWKERGPEWFSSKRFSIDWAAGKWNTRHAGKEAFSSFDSLGYRQSSLLGFKLRAHRVAWAMHYGDWPDEVIDHVNGNRGDNRIANLRESSTSENGMNRGAQNNSASGVKGVCYDKARGRWMANICAGSERKFLGRFDTESEAKAAYRLAAERLHGEFARTE